MCLDCLISFGSVLRTSLMSIVMDFAVVGDDKFESGLGFRDKL